MMQNSLQTEDDDGISVLALEDEKASSGAVIDVPNYVNTFDILHALTNHLEELETKFRADYQQRSGEHALLQFVAGHFKQDGGQSTGLPTLYRQLYASTPHQCSVQKMTQLLMTRHATDATAIYVAGETKRRLQQSPKGLVDCYFEAESNWDTFCVEIDAALNEKLASYQSLPTDECLDLDLSLTDCDSRKVLSLNDMFNGSAGTCTLFVIKRFYGCPACFAHIEQVVRRMHEFQSRGCNVCLVCKGTKEGGSKWKRLTGVKLTMLADEGGSFVRALRFRKSIWNVHRSLTLHKRASLAANGTPYTLVGHVKEDTTHDIYQLGGDCIVDNTGKVLYLHRGTTSDDRPSIEEMLRALPANTTANTSDTSERGRKKRLSLKKMSTCVCEIL